MSTQQVVREADVGASIGNVSAGAGEVIEALGRSWTIALIDKDTKALFEQRLRFNARQALDADTPPREAFPDKASFAAAVMAHEAERKAFLEMVSAFAFKWRGSASQRALAELPGQQFLLYLLLRKSHQDVTEEMAVEIYEDNPESVVLALMTVMRRSDPNRSRPAPAPAVKDEDVVTFDR